MVNGFVSSSSTAAEGRLAIVVVLRAAALAAQFLPFPASAGTPLAAEHRHLMELIQGGTVMVAASPAGKEGDEVETSPIGPPVA